jgi:hypothetical protein
LFFNNLEEVVKIDQLRLMVMCGRAWQSAATVGCDCINHKVCKVISGSNEDRFGYGTRNTQNRYDAL